MRFRFTQERLQALRTEKRTEFVYDDQVQSLACLVTAKGSKSFYMVKNHDGRTHQVRIGKVGELPIPEARKVAARMVIDLEAGKAPDATRRPRKRGLTLAQLYEEYLEFAREHRRPRTIGEYTWQWGKYLKEWAGDRVLTEVRRKDISALHLKLGKENGHHIANRVLAVLRAAINRAIREHELDIPNPAAGILFYREQSRTRRLKPEELPAFFQAVAEEPSANVRDFVLLALFTGARKSNLLAMRWDLVDLERGTWTIPAGQAKAGLELAVALPSYALAILNSRRHLSESGNPWVFPGPAAAGHMLQPESGWRRILARAGLQDLRMHDLRRSLASFQIDTGAPLEVIQKTLGHGNKATTEIYARMAMDPVRASVEKAIEAMVGRAKTG